MDTCTPATPRRSTQSRLHHLNGDDIPSCDVSWHNDSPQITIEPSTPEAMATNPDFEWGENFETPEKVRPSDPFPRSPLKPITNVGSPRPFSPSSPIPFCQKTSTIVLCTDPSTPRTLLNNVGRKRRPAPIKITSDSPIAITAPANINPFTSRTESTAPKRSVVERHQVGNPPSAKVKPASSDVGSHVLTRAGTCF